MLIFLQKVMCIFIGIGIGTSPYTIGYLATDVQPSRTEVEWSKLIAAEISGETEVRTPDGSRVDVLTDDRAYEVEWVEKWKEAPAQAIFYGLTMNRKPTVILLMRGKSSDRRYYLRCLAVCVETDVRLETWKKN